MNEHSFIIEQKPFLALLSSLQAICVKRTTLDVTSYILFQVNYKEIILKATDLEISLQVSYHQETDHVTTPCTFLVQAKRLFDLVKELDGTITCIFEDNQLHLKTDSVNVSLHVRNAQDFPPFPEKIENLISIESSLFAELINKVAFLIPQNNPTVALNGLLIEISDQHLRMTATDGHCLVQVKTNKLSIAQKRKWLLPRRAIFEIKRILESLEEPIIFLGICGPQLVFSGTMFNFFTRLLQDTFPEYETILNKKEFLPARVDRQHLVKTLRRSACLLSGHFIATHFNFSENQLAISLVNKEVGQLAENIPLESFAAVPFSMRFYAPYLLSGLQVFNDKSITFYLAQQTRPIIFESICTEKQYEMTYLVMPVAANHQ